MNFSGDELRKRLAAGAAALKETWNEFQKDEAEQLGAALAYYAMFSIFPLLILMLAAIGFALRHVGAAINAEREILLAAERTFSPQFSDILRQMFEVVRVGAEAATGAGLITLIIAASSVFQQLKISFRKIWRAPQEPAPSARHHILNFIVARLVATVEMLAIAPLLMISLTLTALTQSLRGTLSHLPVIGGAAGYVIGLGVALALNTLILALLFKYLPGVKIRWGDALPGAALTALLWEILKRILTLYVARSHYAGAYGIVGSALILMLWIYFSSQTLFLGAEFTEVYSRRFGSRPRLPKDMVCDFCGSEKNAHGFSA